MVFWLAMALGCGGTCGDRSPVSLSGAAGARHLCAAVATTARQRRAGLVGRPPLAPDQALLIDFPVTDEICITTEPLSYAIDVLFVDAGGRVIQVGCDRGPSDPPLCAAPTRRVLELRPRPDCQAWIGATLRLP